MNVQILRVVAWSKAVLLIATVGLLVTFLFLNAGAAVEPRVHLVFVSYERPGLLGVLLLTALAGLVGGWLVRSAFATLRQLREVRDLSRAAGLRRDVDRLEKAAAEPAKQGPVAGSHVAPSRGGVEATR